MLTKLLGCVFGLGVLVTLFKPRAKSNSHEFELPSLEELEQIKASLDDRNLNCLVSALRFWKYTTRVTYSSHKYEDGRRVSLYVGYEDSEGQSSYNFAIRLSNNRLYLDPGNAVVQIGGVSAAIDQAGVVNLADRIGTYVQNLPRIPL